MKARIKTIDGMAFLGRSGNGPAIVMDDAPAGAEA